MADTRSANATSQVLTDSTGLAMKDSGTEISVVIPMHNESGNVSILIDQLLTALQEESSLEILLVDDGSEDDTWQKIEAVSEIHACVKGLKLSRNFGHQHALLAGLNLANGQAVVSMDADLQHPPKTVPTLIQKWREGAKVVYTKRCQQEKLSAFKRQTSAWFYQTFSWLSGVTIDEGSSDFRLLDRQVLNELIKFNDVTPFFRGAVRWLGFDEQSAIVEYELGDRFSGESAYTLGRMLRFANSGIIAFSTKPLVIGIWLGMITSLLAFAELGYIVVQFMLGNTVPGWASTVGIMALLFGILFMLLGIIGLYLARIHTALQDRPKFVIESITNSGSSAKRAD